MNKKTLINTPAVAEGIKCVGIGKKGSKALDPALIEQILTEINDKDLKSVVMGAFCGALVIKGLSEEERALLSRITAPLNYTNQNLVNVLCADAPPFIQQACFDLLNKKTMSLSKATKIGHFLFSDEPGEGARGLIASVLRVRYETADEYAGLLCSMETLFPAGLKNIFMDKNQLIQLADPFDGVSRTYSVTPLVANSLSRQNYNVISLTGPSSGPKYGNTLLDLLKNLSATEITPANQNSRKPSVYGFFFNQVSAAKPLTEWVERRQLIIKRPFLATLERFINPFHARVMIASAFHAAYGEKMISIGERAGFPGIIIVRNGMEGSINFALKRKTKVLCSARRKDGTYTRIEMDFSPESVLSQTIAIEEKRENPSLTDNIHLIQEYTANGKTSDPWFDNRVKVTCHGIGKALQWVANTID